MSKVYAFNRREVMDTTIYVRANSPAEARKIIAENGADDTSDSKAVVPPTYRRLPEEDAP